MSGDLTDPATLRDALGAVRPHELYHLAAPTFVPASWEDPAAVLAEIAGATAELLGRRAAAGPGPARLRGDVERDLRRRGRVAPARALADAPALALRRGQARGARPGRRAARALRHVRGVGHHLQPRVAAAARALPAAQGDARRGGDRARPPGRARARRPRRRPRLVARGRHHARRVAGAAGRRAARLRLRARAAGGRCASWSTTAFAAAGVSPRGACVVDPAFVRAARVDPAGRRPVARAARAGLGAARSASRR